MVVESLFKSEQSFPERKILSYDEAVTVIKQSRERGLRVIMAQGVFDVIHVGHIKYFRNAKKAGDLLIVGIENDDSVRLNKGEKKPFNKLEDRLELLTELASIDFVFGFTNTPDYGRDVEMFTQRYVDLKPDAIAVSSWDPGINLKRIQAAEAGVEIVLIDHDKRDSSTRLLQMIGHE